MSTQWVKKRQNLVNIVCEQPVRSVTGEWFIDLLSLDLKQDFEYKTAGLASFNNKIHSSNQNAFWEHCYKLNFLPLRYDGKSVLIALMIHKFYYMKTEKSLSNSAKVRSSLIFLKFL